MLFACIDDLSLAKKKFDFDLATSLVYDELCYVEHYVV